MKRGVLALMAGSMVAVAACGGSNGNAGSDGTDTLASRGRGAYDSLAGRRAAFEQQLTKSCEAIYKEQADQYSNVIGWKYNNDLGRCFVEYRYDPPKTPAQCDSMYPPEDQNFVAERLLCHDGRYRLRF